MNPLPDSTQPKTRHLANGEEYYGRIQGVEHVEEFLLVAFEKAELVTPYSAELEVALKELVGSRGSVLRLENEYFCRVWN